MYCMNNVELSASRLSAFALFKCLYESNYFSIFIFCSDIAEIAFFKLQLYSAVLFKVYSCFFTRSDLVVLLHLVLGYLYSFVFVSLVCRNIAFKFNYSNMNETVTQIMGYWKMFYYFTAYANPTYSSTNYGVCDHSEFSSS